MGMALRYLDGKTWAEVTREERVFCQHLYSRLLQRGAPRFVEYLNAHLGLEADVDANWELVYEACFYRDLWQHRGRMGELYSPKRTFDLGLLSDDHIIVVEAKAQQSFDADQVAVFLRDKAQLVAETGVGRVSLVALGSSRCSVPAAIRDSFDGRVLTWHELSIWLDDDAFLRRADDIFEGAEPRRAAQPTTTMTGAELVQAYADGRAFFVGRGGGIDGERFARDVATDAWRTQRYEVNETTSSAPSRNWFTLAEFAARVNARRP